ncbi:MAG: FHA domain-containing protein [Proteobacteria bacterium]|nr:MAG: FHA domain-containing protein [Pseudomonadota bacterium]
MIRIAVYYEENLVREFEQAEEREITIGRAAGCSLQLDEPSISRLHALLRPEGGQWFLERKANFGAVLLNGQEVENAPLEGGEEVSVGKFVLRINIEAPDVQVSSLVSSSNTSSYVEREDDDGRTRFTSSSANGLFRFEPGTANVGEFLLDKEMCVFGRGSNCDVVLTEKKASRKQFEVRRQGLSFFLKDLNSANGTFVNGGKVSEVELVSGDVIAVGESQIQFSVESKDYFSRQDQFLAVPAHLHEAGMSPAYGNAPGSDPMAGYGDDGMGMGAENAGPPPEPEVAATDVIGRAKRAWSRIPRPQRIRYLIILVAFAFVVSLLGEPDKTRVVRKPAPGSTAARRYESLTAAKKKFVREKYAELVKAQEKKDFQKMADAARDILGYVDDYKDTKSYENMAKKSLEAIEEERKRKLAEEKQLALKKEVEALQEKGRGIFEKALGDAKYRPELDALIQDIYAKDPNNRLAREWKEKIKQKDEDDRIAADRQRQRDELKGKAEDAYAAVEKTFAAGRYIDALKEAEKLGEIGWDEKEYTDKIESLKNNVRTKLSSVIDPLLKEAATQRGEGGDLVRARELYKEVRKVDPSNKDAMEGIGAIRDVLHSRAKRLYAEAEIAYSLSDLAEAKEKYEKCLRVSPDDDLYRKRCKSRMSRFDAFNGTDGGNSSGGGF